METAWKIIEFVKKNSMSSNSESSSSGSLKQFGHVNIRSILRTQSVCAMCLHTIQILPWSEARSSTEQTQWTFDISSHSPDLFSRFFGGFATLFRDAPSLIFAAASTTFASMLARVARCAIFAGFSVDFAGTLARLASLADFFCCWSCCIAQQPFC